MHASCQCTLFTAAVSLSLFAVHSACLEPRAPDPPSGQNGVITGRTTKKADGTVCGSEPLDPGSIQFATAAPRLHHSRWNHLTQLRSLQEVQAALPCEAQAISHTVSQLNSFACLADLIGHNIRISPQHATKCPNITCHLDGYLTFYSYSGCVRPNLGRCVCVNSSRT